MAKVVDCVRRGGKVLVPVFAVGRAQELCILLETYLERMNLNVPIYFASGLSEKVNTYYSLFVSWTNEKIQSTFHQKNIFDFKHIKVKKMIWKFSFGIYLFLALGSIVC
jgi:integrator complex subunit 11